VTRRPRQLSREERELWAVIARATIPLKGRRPPTAPDPVAAPPPTPVAEPPKRGLAPGKFKPAAPQPAKPKPAAPKPAAPPAAPLVPLERKAARALARGRATADAVIDLHGMTQAEAHGALIRFLYRAQAAGHAIVLVVTGKGVASDGHGEGTGRGVLRRMVPHWLTLPDLRPIVLGFDEAGPRQGGGGALYVRLRRNRAGS
jgi:DNA-nicking Smr family endonuclease